MQLEIEARQRELFDALADDYEAHYDDATSQAYRDRFIHPHLFRGIPLRGRRVLDAMCGSGETTRHLLRQGAIVDGLDISGSAIARYRRRWPACRGFARSILRSGLESESYDVVAMVGGLHHLHPHTTRALDEIDRLIKPGGHLCLLEPHAGSLPDLARRFWYRRDALFEENEAAIDLGALRAHLSDRFEFLDLRYTGNLAYLLVLNSMIFRVPTSLKRLYAPPLMALEGLIGWFQGRRLSCVAIGRWRKRDG